jgi:hypothetical protein
MKRIAMALVVALALVSTTEPGVSAFQGPSGPPSALDTTVKTSPFIPPQWYRVQLDSALKCSGLKKPKKPVEYSKIVWATYPAYSIDGGSVAAYWVQDTTGNGADSIVFDTRFTDSSFIVRHELLHWVRQVGGHPYIPFDVPCFVTFESRRFLRSVETIIK